MTSNLKKRLILLLGIPLVLPLVFLFGAALADLLHSTIFITDRILPWDEGSVIGGFVAGIMTVFAGWLAFREARKANRDNHQIQAKNLLIEHMKAVNTVSEEIVKIYKTACEIGALQLNNISVFEAAAKPALFNAKSTVLAAQEVRKMIPKLIQISSPPMANALVILPQSIIKYVNQVNEAINNLQLEYKKALPETASFSEDDLAWRNGLVAVYMPTGEPDSKLNQILNCTRIALSFLDKMRIEYSNHYEQIVHHLIHPLNLEKTPR